VFVGAIVGAIDETAVTVTPGPVFFLLIAKRHLSPLCPSFYRFIKMTTLRFAFMI
jgi:hypothetical protein